MVAKFSLGASVRGYGSVTEETAMRTVQLSVNSRYDLDDKISAIKAVRALTGMGLKDAKEFVEAINPGHSEIMKIGANILEPMYSDNLKVLRESGFRVEAFGINNAARRDIGEQLRQVITYATMTSQYDISRVLIDVMETYCPEPSPGYEDKVKTDNNNEEEI